MRGFKIGQTYRVLDGDAIGTYNAVDTFVVEEIEYCEEEIAISGQYGYDWVWIAEGKIELVEDVA